MIPKCNCERDLKKDEVGNWWYCSYCDLAYELKPSNKNKIKELKEAFALTLDSQVRKTEQEIQKNKDLRDKIVKLKEIFQKRAVRMIKERNNIPNKQISLLATNLTGHISEAELICFEIDKLFPPGSLDDIGGGNKLDS